MEKKKYDEVNPINDNSTFEVSTDAEDATVEEVTLPTENPDSDQAPYKVESVKTSPDLPLITHTVAFPDLSDPEPEPVAESVADRRLLLKLNCVKGGGCCGGSGKASTKYAILTVRKELDGNWKLIKNTRLYGNYMDMCKKDGLWAGSVVSMGLDQDEGFMTQLKACADIWTGDCKVI